MIKLKENKLLLDDETLTTPEHDKLILDLLDKEKCLLVIPEIVNLYSGSDKEEFLSCFSVFSETPIKSKGRTVGYTDIKIVFDIDKIYKYILLHRSKEEAFKIREAYGYLHIYLEAKPKVYSFGETLRQLVRYQDFLIQQIFREKSAIYISSEERRKIKLIVYLYTPDTTFKSAFESQGFKVITPPK